MEAPTFDYSNMHTQQPGGESDAGAIEPQHVVESASASTAPQANSSNFAYILTGVTLGVIALLMVAFALLMFGVMGTAFSASHTYDDLYEHPGYSSDWEQFEHDHADELEQFEEELLSNLLEEEGYAA